MISSSSFDQYGSAVSDSPMSRLRHIITQVSRMLTQEGEEKAVEPLSMEYLIAEYSLMKMRHEKAIILRSSVALVSILSSLVLIWMIRRSHTRFSTPYHRLLFGFCIGDLIFSVSNSFFNAWVPRELDYLMWNARGNSTTCTIQGFCYAFGLGWVCLHCIIPTW